MSLDLSFIDDARLARDAETGDDVKYSGSDPEDASYWQSGSINITAEDGSQIQVTPVKGQRGEFMIRTGNGETVGPVAVDLKP